MCFPGLLESSLAQGISIAVYQARHITETSWLKVLRAQCRGWRGRTVLFWANSCQTFLTGDEADVQGQSKREESLSQRLPISYSLLDPQPQRQGTAAALQGPEAAPHSQPPPHPLPILLAQRSAFLSGLPCHVTSLERVGLLGAFSVFRTLRMFGAESHSG